MELAINSYDDQEVLNHMFVNLDKWRHRIHLDQSQRCFGSAHNSGNFFTLKGGRWRAHLPRETPKTAPAVMHYNGGSKKWEMKDSLNASIGVGEPWSSGMLAKGAVTLVGPTWSTTTTRSMASMCSAAESMPSTNVQ